MKKINVVILSIISLITTSTIFPESEPDNAQLDRREKEALSKLSDIDNLSEYYGRIIYIRDNLILGSKGLDYHFKNCTNQLGIWINDWSFLLSSIDLHDKENTNLVQNSVKNFLQKQIDKGETLKQNCSIINNKVNEAKLVINKMPEFNSNKLTEYKQIIDEIEKVKFRLIQILDKYRIVQGDKVEKINELIELTRKASLAKLKTELVGNIKIPLQNAILEFQAMLDASKLSDQAISQILNSEQLMDKFVLNMQYFKAKNLLLKSKEDCLTQLSNLEKSSIDKKYLFPIKERITNLCSATENHFRSLTQLNIKNYEYLKNYYELVNANISIDCNNKNNTLSCQKLNIINSIDTETLSTLPDSNLEFIENLLSQVYEEYKK
ncbi:hypothetical protein QEJ31_06115 [Pigmentibacter sp. JX0631]|uniref:hypothetical protein n=1 Tax=Pigmentibacter sp. JX0631 TaxID=2976982 RepID=UPI002468C496|nr:hypothetical protein [Pigmentibacter sp. JX0631]WGL61170.1 hypothetical protein QEJ31_06115 [Pigmentibacter sp. JX0631]